MIKSQITKFTKILCHENLELYGIHVNFDHVWAGHYPVTLMLYWNILSKFYLK